VLRFAAMSALVVGLASALPSAQEAASPADLLKNSFVTRNCIRRSKPGSRMLSQCPHQFLRCRFAVAQRWVIAGPVAGEVNGAINREGRMSLKSNKLGLSRRSLGGAASGRHPRWDRQSIG